MAAELIAPRKLIERWPAHGDVRVLVDGPRVWLAADDVENVAGIPPWGRGEQLLPDDGELEHLLGAEYMLLDVVRARCAIEATDLTREFLLWIRSKHALWVSPEVQEAAHNKPGYVDAFEVAEAAHVLAVGGRQRLFNLLRELGWIDRRGGDGDWEIQPPAAARDLLTVRPLMVGPGRKRPYQQIHITQHGMAELERRLFPPRPPTPPPEPDPAPTVQPTLFD